MTGDDSERALKNIPFLCLVVPGLQHNLLLRSLQGWPLHSQLHRALNGMWRLPSLSPSAGGSAPRSHSAQENQHKTWTLALGGKAVTGILRFGRTQDILIGHAFYRMGNGGLDRLPPRIAWLISEVKTWRPGVRVCLRNFQAHGACSFPAWQWDLGVFLMGVVVGGSSTFFSQPCCFWIYFNGSVICKYKLPNFNYNSRNFYRITTIDIMTS